MPSSYYFKSPAFALAVRPGPRRKDEVALVSGGGGSAKTGVVNKIVSARGPRCAIARTESCNARGAWMPINGTCDTAAEQGCTHRQRAELLRHRCLAARSTDPSIAHRSPTLPPLTCTMLQTALGIVTSAIDSDHDDDIGAHTTQVQVHAQSLTGDHLISGLAVSPDVGGLRYIALMRNRAGGKPCAGSRRS
jgi:hypothetical protein